MKLAEIKEEVEKGNVVYWKHSGYRVKKDDKGQWLIVHDKSTIGLTTKQGVLNGDENEFKVLFTYKLFVDGRFITQNHDYGDMFQRALGVVCYLEMKDAYINPQSPNLIDKWKDENHLVIVSKENVKL